MRYPRRNERVFMQSRMDNKEYPDGLIIQVMRNFEDPEFSEVMVRFVSPSPAFERAILTYGSEVHYKIEYEHIRLYDGEERTELIDQSKFQYIYIGAEYEFEPCDEIITLTFSDLEGNWSSSDGGSGRWEL